MSNELPRMEQLGEQERFDKKKKLYFTRLALKYREYLKFHQESGQLIRDSKFGTEKFTDSKGAEKERNKRWGNPTEHCLVEAAIAEIVAESTALPSADKETLIVSALLHDWRKRGEIEETRGEKDPQNIEESYRKSKEGIFTSGIENAEEITGLIDSVAHTSLPDFATLQQDNSIALRENLSELGALMHYIDDITRGTDVVTLDERMDYLDKVAAERYPYNEEGRAIWGGRTFFQAQREIGHLIEQKVAEKMGIEDSKDLPNVLKKKLRERIESAHA